MADHLAQAELLADLGRYDEAAAELEPEAERDPAAATLLAWIRLASGAPRQALAAVEAPAEHPADQDGTGSFEPELEQLVVRGMALVESGRVDEAARVAEAILRRAPADGNACASAAVIMSAGRPGKIALDAAWEGVRRCPEQPRAHLILGVVAAALELPEIARRAYQEAMALDPRLAQTEPAPGVARWELHRYAVALGRFLGEPPAAQAGPGGAPASGLGTGGLREWWREFTARFRR